MPHSIFSTGHTRKKRSEPSHTQKKPTKSQSFAAGLGATKSQQKAIKPPKTKKAHNREVYQGAALPYYTTKGNSKQAKHERNLKKRGKAVRRIVAPLEGKRPKELRGHSNQTWEGETPFQAIKDVSRIRETALKQVETEIHKLHKKLSDSTLDPKTRIENHSLLTQMNAEKARLKGRTTAWTATKIQGYIKDERKALRHLEKEFSDQMHKGHLTDANIKEIRHYLDKQKNRIKHRHTWLNKERKRSEQLFKNAHSRRKISQETAEAAVWLPKAKGVLGTGKGTRFQVNPSEMPTQVTNTKGVPINTSKLLTRKGIEELGEKRKAAAGDNPDVVGAITDAIGVTHNKEYDIEAKMRPIDPVEAGITAASLIPIGRVGLGIKALLKLGAVGAGEDIAAQAARGAIEPLFRGSDTFVRDVTSGSLEHNVVTHALNPEAGFVTSRGSNGAVRSIAVLNDEGKWLLQNAEKTAGKRALDNQITKDVIENGKVTTSKPKPGESLGGLISRISSGKGSKETKDIIITSASSDANKELEYGMRGPIAGGGSATDVAEAKVQNSAYQYKPWLRSKVTGAKLKLMRGGKVALVGAVPLGIWGGTHPNFREHMFNDTTDLIAGAVPSSLMFLTASGEVMFHTLTLGHAGSTSRMEHIWEGYLETSPIALMAELKFDEAYKMAKERPVTTLLELMGGYQAAGRGAGMVLRSPIVQPFTFLHPKVKALVDFAKVTQRDPTVIFGDIKDIGGYSANIMTKKLQIWGDNFYNKKVSDLMKDHEIDFSGKEPGPKLSRADRYFIKQHGQRMQMRLEKALAEMHSIQLIHSRTKMREVETDIVRNFLEPAHKHHDFGPSALNLIGAGLIKPKTFVDDLKGLQADLQLSRDHPDEFGPTKNSKQAAVVSENINIVNHLIEHQWDLFSTNTLFDIADEYRKYENNHQAQLVQMKALHPDAAEYAPWIPYAVREMGARYRYVEGSRTKGAFWHTVEEQEPIYEKVPKAKKARVKATPTYRKVKKELTDATDLMERERLNMKTLRGKKQEDATIQLALLEKKVKGLRKRKERLDRSHKERIQKVRDKEPPPKEPKVKEYKKQVTEKELTLDEIKAHAANRLDKAMVNEDGSLREPAMITSRMIDGEDAGNFEGVHLPTAENLSNTGALIRQLSFDMASRSLLRQSIVSSNIIMNRRYLQIIHDRSALRVQGIAHPVYFLPKLDDEGNIALVPRDKPGSGRPMDATYNANRFIEKHFGDYYGPKLRVVHLAKFMHDFNLGDDAAAAQAEVLGSKDTAHALYEDVAAAGRAERTDPSSIRALLEGEEGSDVSRIKAEMRNLIDPNTYRQLQEDAKRAPGEDLNDIAIVIPEEVYKHLKAQQASERATGKFMKRINREFKGSVLAFNPKWHIGNVVDMLVRSFFGGVGYQSYKQGRAILQYAKEHDKTGTLYNDLMSAIAGGHIKHAQDVGDFLRHVDKNLVDQKNAYTVRALHTVLHMGPRGYRYMQNKSFQMGAKLEEMARVAGLGKAATRKAIRMGENFSNAYRLTPTVIHQIVEGLTNTDEIRNMSRYVNDVFGDYTTLSPLERSVMHNYAPFYLWLRASTKFVFSLPAKSPIRVSMLAAVNRMTEPERAMLGLSTFHGEAEDKVLPKYMRGSVPATLFGGDPTQLIRTNAYTSFGPLTDLSSLPGFLLPQFDFAVNAFKGEDWLGEPLINPDGSLVSVQQGIGILLQQALETYVAPIGLIHKAIAEGDPSGTYSILDVPKDIYHGITGHGKIAANERKHYKDPFTGETEESPKYDYEGGIYTGSVGDFFSGLGKLATHGIIAKIASPGYVGKNTFVENKQKKRTKRSEEVGATNPTDEWYEKLYGVKTPSTRKKHPKLYKKPNEDWYSKLYGN